MLFEIIGEIKIMKPIIQNINQLQQSQFLVHLMQNTFKLLQMNILELKDYVFSEVEKNPLLETEYKYFSFNRYTSYPIDYLESKKSLFHHLMTQAREFFKQKDLNIAENIIGNLDENGFFTISIKEISKNLKIAENKVKDILNIIQTFDPIGIAAKNLQESLLLQIADKNSLSYLVIDKYFDKILQNKIPWIAKKLNIESKKLQLLLEKTLKKLDFSPGRSYSQDSYLTSITPDILIKKEGKNWIVEINEEDIPIFKINQKYKKIKNLPKKYLFSFKHLQKNILLRRKTLIDIAFYIIKKQRAFLMNKAPLKPMTVKEVAEKLNVHISTISRAISNKYVKCPNAIFAMKAFFTNPLFNNETKSQANAIEVLKQLIENEDKKKPLSDEALSRLMKKNGFNLQRRTIAKYRKKLLIGTSNLRKKIN